VIWTKNVTLFRIKFRAIFNREGNKDEYKHQSRPPPINYPNQLMLVWDYNRYAQQGQQDQEQHGKYDHTVACMNYAKYLHGSKNTK
jgi:hypothetical protein